MKRFGLISNSKAHEDVPPDYRGDFRRPASGSRCWCIVRSSRTGCVPPRQCLGRRRSYDPRSKTFGTLCCQAHRDSEAAAAAFAEALAESAP
jgi:hypothetical protein